MVLYKEVFIVFAIVRRRRKDVESRMMDGMFSQTARDTCMGTRHPPRLLLHQPRGYQASSVRTSASTQGTGNTRPSLVNTLNTLFSLVARKETELTEGVESWQACSDLCSRRRGCRYWTWHKQEAGQYAFRCVTMTDVDTRVSDNNAVSGTKKCEGISFS